MPARSASSRNAIDAISREVEQVFAGKGDQVRGKDMVASVRKALGKGRHPMKIISDIEGAIVRAAWEETDLPLLLRWIDPKSGEELSVEMWGPREFADDLVELGFEVLTPPVQDESASSLCVFIRQTGG